MGHNASVPALTETEIQLVKDSWTQVATDLKGNGFAILIALFKKYPDYQLKFKSFSDVPLDVLDKQPKAVGHVLSVMYTITALVNSLDDKEVIKAMVAKQVTNHAPRGILYDYFKNLGAVILEIFGDLMTPEAAKAWERAIDAFLVVAEETVV